MLIRLLIAVVVAVLVGGFYQGYATGNIYLFDLVTLSSFALATVITVLLTARLDSNPARGRNKAVKTTRSDKKPAADDDDAEREEGTVKWFNVSKGFGFITRSNGEDIFVHYRSIRGQGRRRLFDGQQVTFCIIDSGKGLQADDVDIIQ